MTEFFSIFGAYDFVIRDGIVLSLVALSLYVVLSAGIFAVPQVGLMAVGAYVSAVLSVDAGAPFVVSLIGGTLASGFVALLLAGLLHRLNGIYLAIASIAFAEIVRVAVLNLPLTGGAQGKVGIPRTTTDLVICIVVVVAVAGLIALKRSRFGLAISAMREDSLMASHQGIDVVRYRTALFALSGILAGAAGALHVHMSGFVEPGQFSFELLTQLLAIVVIGGTVFVTGSLVGALVIIGLPVALTGLAAYEALVNGVLIVLIVAFAPSGILGSLRSWWPVRSSPFPPDSADETSAERVLPLVRDDGPAGDTVLEVRDVVMSFGGLHALDAVSVEARSGEVLGIIGPNGSGKTTLLNVLSGVYRPESGTGTLLEHDFAELWGHPHVTAQSGLARTFQNIRLMDEETVSTNVRLGIARRPGIDVHERTRDLLTENRLDWAADIPVGSLPYGVRRRVEIARALAREPRVLLLDEPTAGMNPTERQDVFDTISDIRSRGVAVIVVEHDVAMMRSFCDRLVVLDFGRKIAEGKPGNVLDSKEVIRAYIGSGSLA
ncbi:Branched-chain amino acid transport ATP-binding protein LivG [Rhodococcus wratislaviensis]|uniref:Branched-chain amino acid transport ATP-binding protein LivG n=1 Tax=Rhodococcus wratislaviensis TaxID=44752 RepID=A0A402CCC9_RHOWR|nr:branched-chain amino acid ABC transporter ATP-binding protein/permease [Rhodococcus wratislaviensis]GCE41248.1 Branched-chain amino acid transport ATP-binding protein LivG [Rhodococcus wratislaviensis]